MQITNKLLHRNPDGSLKIYDYKEFAPYELPENDPLNTLRFIVGSYRVNGEKYIWRIPLTEQFLTDCPPDKLDSYVTQVFESHIKELA